MDCQEQRRHSTARQLHHLRFERGPAIRSHPACPCSKIPQHAMSGSGCSPGLEVSGGGCGRSVPRQHQRSAKPGSHNVLDAFLQAGAPLSKMRAEIDRLLGQ